MYNSTLPVKTTFRAVAALAALLFSNPANLRAQFTDTTLDGTIIGKADLVTTNFGRFATIAGDLNADGFDDIVVCDQFDEYNCVAERCYGPGVLYIIPGAADGFGSRTSYADASIRQIHFSHDPTDYNTPNVGEVGRVQPAGDVNGDGIDDLFVGVPARRVDFDPTGADLHLNNDLPVGSAFVVYGQDGSFPSGDLREITAGGVGGFEILGIDLFGRVGADGARIGDMNGDGIDDLAVSAPRAGLSSENRRDAGDVYVIFGRPGGYSDGLSFGTISGHGIDLRDLDGTNGFVIRGKFDPISESADFKLGSGVAGIGDFNKDGFADIAMTAPMSYRMFGRAGASIAGATYIVYGSSSGHGGALDIDSLNGSNGFALYNAYAYEFSEAISGVGDVNGDGFDDFAVALRGASSQVILGTDEALPTYMDARDLPPGRGSSFNSNRVLVEGVGDVNGDRLDDFVSHSRSGTVSLHYGSRSGIFRSSGIRDPDSSNRYFGISTAGSGDFNGDGVSDIVLGTIPDGDGVGSVSLLLGEGTGAAYFSWIEQFFPGVSDLDVIHYREDPNGDGVSNALAFAMGLSPTEPPPGSLIDINLTEEHLVVSFRQRTGLPESLPLLIEISTKLGFWIPLFDGNLGAIYETETDFFAPGIDRIRVSVPRAIVGASGTSLFARVRVYPPT